MPEPTHRGHVIESADDLDLTLPELLPRPLEVRVLMADPAFFDVLYVINPHMAGNIGSVDKGLARRQWEQVRDAYAGIGFPIELIQGVEGLPDLVFMANQSFPGQLPDGRWAAILSYMHAPERRAEVEATRVRCEESLNDLNVTMTKHYVTAAQAADIVGLFPARANGCRVAAACSVFGRIVRRPVRFPCRTLLKHFAYLHRSTCTTLTWSWACCHKSNKPNWRTGSASSTCGCTSISAGAC